MSLNITKVWQLVNGKEVLVPSNAIVPGDEVVVHMGNVIPFDGVLTSGDAMVNQASLTGEPLPVHKTTGGYVYAGTVVEDGDLTLKVEKSAGGTRFEKVVAMIEDSEKLKSSLEGKAEHLADRACAVYSWPEPGSVSSYTKCDEDAGSTDGRFFLCIETGDADFRAICDTGGQSLSGDRKRRKISGSNVRSRYDCI